MKNLIVIIFTLFMFSANAQVVGNKKVVTKFFALDNIYRIDIQMYAKVTIDMDMEPGIRIEGESNIIDLIRKDVNNRILTLDQKEWIKPTIDIKIIIGAPGLKELEVGTHDKTIVKNIIGKSFKVDAPIGHVILSGRVEELSINSKKGRVDASGLFCNSADVVIKSDGIVIVNANTNVDCEIDEDGKFENIVALPNTIDCSHKNNDLVQTNVKNRYINIKIKNNSLKRNHFVVVGPKPNGRNFSYGFPMLPFQSKNERWTIGTKIYKENTLGIRKLLVTLSADDEDRTLKLFN